MLSLATLLVAWPEGKEGVFEFVKKLNSFEYSIIGRARLNISLSMSPVIPAIAKEKSIKRNIGLPFFISILLREKIK